MPLAVSGTHSSTSLLPSGRVFGPCNERLAVINRINEKELRDEFDLVIIGGGINGCGIVRDASERGLKVILLEKEDFGAGCTSVPSRLIHGGLRYLEHFEFDLVRESLREREILLKNANHLVKPLKMSIPIYDDDKRGPFIIKIGMILYDLLSYDKSLPRHRMLSAEEFIRAEPGVNSNGLRGAAIYYDAQVDYPERLCLENALMAKNYGALVLNHAEVINIDIENSNVSSVEFLDKLSGKLHKVKGKLVINVSGPWVDELCGLTGRGCKRLIGGTIGSHIVIKKYEAGPKNAIYASAQSDKRPFFIIPWQNYYLIGTTDIPVNGNIDYLNISEQEVEYLLKETNHVLSPNKITRNDILFSYTGVRALPYVDQNRRKDPASITRRHLIHDHKEDGINNLISIIGGKLTTYRSLSEELVNYVYGKLDYKFIRSRTSSVPLYGNVSGNFDEYKTKEAREASAKYSVPNEIALHLVGLHGKNYKRVIDLVKNSSALSRTLSPYSHDIAAQVVYSMSDELAFTVSDILLRRTSLGLSERLGQDSIPQVSSMLKSHFQLPDSEIAKQVKEYEEKVIKLRKL